MSPVHPSSGPLPRPALLFVLERRLEEGECGSLAPFRGSGSRGSSAMNSDEERRLELLRHELEGAGRAAPAAGRRGDGGAIGAGYSLVVYRGGTVDELGACAEGLGATALYVLRDGEWVGYLPGAPEFVNGAFRELFAGGVPPLTPLLVGAD